MENFNSKRICTVILWFYGTRSESPDKNNFIRRKRFGKINLAIFTIMLSYAANNFLFRILETFKHVWNYSCWICGDVHNLIFLIARKWQTINTQWKNPVRGTFNFYRFLLLFSHVIFINTMLCVKEKNFCFHWMSNKYFSQRKTAL